MRDAQKDTDDEDKRKKRILLLILLLFLILLAALAFLWFKQHDYDINKNPKANMITINKLITNSDTCDKKWVEEAKALIEKLNNESEKIKKMNSKDESYKEALRNFATLQKEVASSLNRIIDYLDSRKTLDNPALVDDLENIYAAYRKYYNANIVKGGSL